MLNAEILKTIECAIPHNCAKGKNESNKCAHCEIGYEFIAMDPKSLKCGHNICNICETRVDNGSVQCKFCQQERELSYAKGAAADLFVNLNLDTLVVELKTKYKNAFTIYDGIFE